MEKKFECWGAVPAGVGETFESYGVVYTVTRYKVIGWRYCQELEEELQVIYVWGIPQAKAKRFQIWGEAPVAGSQWTEGGVVYTVTHSQFYANEWNEEYGEYQRVDEFWGVPK